MQEYKNDPRTTDESNLTISDKELIEESSPSDNEPNHAESDEALVEEEANGELKKEESRTRRAFRKFIRWTVGLLVVFGLGFLTAVFTIYNPKLDELDQSQNNLTGAGNTIAELESTISAQQSEIDTLNAKITTLNQNITDLETQNQELLNEQGSFNLLISLLKARADIISAQVELYQGNPAQARVLLENTSQSLTTIESLLPGDLKGVVAPLQNRLELAVGEIDEDPETAIADLSILAGDLLEIENALFGE